MVALVRNGVFVHCSQSVSIVSVSIVSSSCVHVIGGTRGARLPEVSLSTSVQIAVMVSFLPLSLNSAKTCAHNGPRKNVQASEAPFVSIVARLELRTGDCFQ